MRHVAGTDRSCECKSQFILWERDHRGVPRCVSAAGDADGARYHVGCGGVVDLNEPKCPGCGDPGEGRCSLCWARRIVWLAERGLAEGIDAETVTALRWVIGLMEVDRANAEQEPPCSNS